MLAIALATLIGWTAPIFGQPLCPPASPMYQSLRYHEEYVFLHNPGCHTDLWDPVKYISLADREDVYVSLGGEVRLQYEYFRDADWGEGPQDPNGYLLPRLMLHTDWQLGPYVRLFGQLKSGLAVGRTGGPWPYVEFFTFESWLEHLRQHKRVTAADRGIEARARAFHRGEHPPVVTHLVADAPLSHALRGMI